MSNSRNKMDRNREKLIQDRLQVLLTKMLQDEDNKYCVDCDSKGPRWASWNIGIFLCIRCAGIHRNLGVHISKVKSVNLDSWTPNQVASMQIMGNSKGRAVYEARVPEDWRRPQTDSALESFIRAKYEKKKYVAREWTQTKPPDLPHGWAEIIEAEKQKKDIRSIVLPSRAQNSSPTHSAEPKTTVPAKEPSATANNGTTKAEKKVEASNGVAAPTSAAVDLLGLTTGPPVGASDSLAKAAPNAKLSSDFDLLCLGSSSGNADGGNNEFDDFVGASTTSISQPQSSDFVTSENKQLSSQMSKDSIMALFNKPIPGGGGGAMQNAPRPTTPAPGGIGLTNMQQQPAFRMGAPPQGNPMGFPPASGVLGQRPLMGNGMLNQQLNQFGLSQPQQSSTMNNPFLSNTADLGFGAMNGGSTTNGSHGNQTWGFN